MIVRTVIGTGGPLSDDDLAAALHAGARERRFDTLEQLYDTDRPRIVEAP